MALARNLLRRHYDSCGSCFSADANSGYNKEKASLVVSSSMAEEEEEGEDTAGCSSTTSKEEGDKDRYKGWLQLGISGHCCDSVLNNSTDHPMSSSSTSTHSRVRSLELNLFSERPPFAMMSGSKIPYNFGQLGCLSSSSGPAVECRVVSPPPRTQPGVWFELRAAENQGKQPFLPQIPKCYLRIKDGRMTVRLLMKYLANKLELNDESQVEITCRGQHLHPVLTLQYIRDNIWCRAPTVMMMPLNLPITDHVMILHYGRRA